MQWDVIHLALVDVDGCDGTLVLVWWQLVLVEIGTRRELLRACVIAMKPWSKGGGLDL